MDTAPVSTPRVAFSALFAESDHFLSTYIDNFLLNTGQESHLFINLPPGRKVPDAAKAMSARVHPFSGTLARSKLGHTLLCAHLESFAEASRILGRFDYFCTLASNSLFVRPFDLPLAIAGLSGVGRSRKHDLDHLEDDWWWGRLKKSPDALAYMKAAWGLTHASSKQIEGLITTAENWRIVHDNLPEVVEFSSRFVPEFVVPLEEIIPSTLFDSFGTHEYLNICHNLWDRGPDLPATMEDLLEFSTRHSAEICMLKWFDRTSDSASTAAVSTDWIATFLRSLPRSDTTTGGERLKHRIILDGALRYLKQRECFEALARTWEPIRSATDREDLTATARVTREDAAVATLIQEKQHNKALAYVYKEPDVPGFDLSLTVRTGSPDVTLAARSYGVPVDSEDDSMPHGYVYLACPPSPSELVIRIQLPHTTDDARSIVPGNLTLRHGSRYARLPSMFDESDQDHYSAYYRIPPDPDEAGSWIGIPFRIGLSLDVRIESLT